MDYNSPPSTPGSSQTQRTSKTVDMAHLLDPSYSSSRVTYNQIYIDPAGQAHDPDFRLFAPASYSPKRPDFFLTSESDFDVDDEGTSLYSRRRSSFDSYRHRPDSRVSDVYSHDVGSTPFTYTFDDSPRRESNKLRRRKFSFEHYRPVEELPEPVEEEEPPTPVTPAATCSQTFRRQWHILRLRTQVAAFRMRKRVCRIVSG